MLTVITAPEGERHEHGEVDEYLHVFQHHASSNQQVSSQLSKQIGMSFESSGPKTWSNTDSTSNTSQQNLSTRPFIVSVPPPKGHLRAILMKNHTLL